MMNFKKIYENSLTYEHGDNGPFDKWETSIKTGKEQKPAVKGLPHFKYEKASQPASNKPSCPYEEDTYNARYSKTGSLTEKEINELKKLKILTENFDDEEDFVVDKDDFDSEIENMIMDSEGYFGEDEEEIEDWERHEIDDFNLEDEDLEDENLNIDFDSSEIYDPEDEDLEEYDNDGKGTLGDDFLSDEERHSSLGKLNRGEDFFESTKVKSGNLNKLKELEFEIEDEENIYDDITDSDSEEYDNRIERILHKISIKNDPDSNLYKDLYEDEDFF
jgi:hypothetical protein